MNFRSNRIHDCLRNKDLFIRLLASGKRKLAIPKSRFYWLACEAMLMHPSRHTE